VVGYRREELVEEVAVGGVDFGYFEPCVEGALGRGAEGVDDRFDILLVHRSRGGRFVLVGPGVAAR